MERHGQLPGRSPWLARMLRPRRGNPRGRRHTARLIAVAVAVTLAAAACGGNGSGSSVKDGGVFRLGSNSSIDSLNPFVAFQGDAYVDVRVHLSRAGPVQRRSCSSWRTSRAAGRRAPDGKIWTFHTQPGAKWSDGKPLTAADAAWTYSTILKYQDGADRQLRGLRRAPEERHRAERHHAGADLQAAGGQRAVAGAAGADPARARLGQVRHRQRQGADPVHQQRADRVRRPVHPDQVHAEADRAVQAQPDVLRPEAAHRRLRAAVLPDHATR